MNGTFTYMESGSRIGRERWITHDPDDHFAGEFTSEADAAAACKRLNEYGGEIVKVGFNSGSRISEHDRGTHTITIKGTGFKWRGDSSWGNTEQCARVVAKIRDAVAKHGVAVVSEIAEALTGERDSRQHPSLTAASFSDATLSGSLPEDCPSAARRQSLVPNPCPPAPRCSIGGV